MNLKNQNAPLNARKNVHCRSEVHEGSCASQKNDQPFATGDSNFFPGVKVCLTSRLLQSSAIAILLYKAALPFIRNLYSEFSGGSYAGNKQVLDIPVTVVIPRLSVRGPRWQRILTRARACPNRPFPGR